MARKRSSGANPVAASSMKACKTRKLTSKILKEAYAQQREMENEKHAEEFPMSTVFNQAVYYESEDFIDDVDVLSEFQNQLDYQYQDVTNEEEDKLLDAIFGKDGASIAKRLSNAITSTKEERQDKEDDATGTALMSKSKVIELYQSLGKFMSVYTKGKMPKALTNVPIRENWDSLLMLTQPENWSPNAMYMVTSMFASSGCKAERFYKLFLLPRVREDIRKHKKLPRSVYESLIKALFNPGGFYNGIIIPLCQSGTCTISEAVIIGRVIQKCSIPQEFSSAALIILLGMTFGGTRSYFIKVILEKNYALACGAIDAVTTYFLRFHKEKTAMPVIWHQTLLAFVQRYKHELRSEDEKSLRNLLDKQHHKLITPEIVRELDNSRNHGEKFSNSPSAPTVIKTIKEDMFDMPQVPMEED